MAARGLCLAERRSEMATLAIRSQRLRTAAAQVTPEGAPRSAQLFFLCRALPSTWGLLQSLPDPRVHCGVQQIGQEIDRNVSQSDGENASLHQVVVSIGNGLNG